MSLITLAKKAAALLLFDQSSQQILAEIASSSRKGSKDFNIITLSQASLGFYNGIENSSQNIPAVINATKTFLKKINKDLLDPVNKVLYYKLMSDMEVQNSLYKFNREELKRTLDTWKVVYNESDENAKKTYLYILKLLPKNLKRALPADWVTDWIALFSPFYNHVISFYQPNVSLDRKNRKLKDILIAIRNEANLNVGIALFKQYIAHQKIDLEMGKIIKGLINMKSKALLNKINKSLITELKDVEDIQLPKRVSIDGILEAVSEVRKNVEDEREKGNQTKYTTSLLHLGILFYLSRNYENAIKVLLNVLLETKKINVEEKKEKINCHETFPDIPFMIGSSYLKLCLKHLEKRKGNNSFDVESYLLKAKKAFTRSIALSKNYHQSFINKILVEHLLTEGLPLKEFQVYKNSFDSSLMKLDKRVFQMMAFFEKENDVDELTPKSVFNLLLYLMNNEKTSAVNEAEEMLADLKTLYVLNSYDITVFYYSKFKAHTKNNTTDFCNGLRESRLHSAMLFYFAHSFCSLSIKRGKDGFELDYKNISEAIELNINSLFFYESNSSSLRLLDTITQIINFICEDIVNREENKAHSIRAKMLIYEDYLNIQKVKENYIKELKSIGFENSIPKDIGIPVEMKRVIESSLSDDQKEKILKRLSF